MPVPGDLAAVLGEYTAKLARAPLSAQTRRTYAAKVRRWPRSVTSTPAGA